MVFSLLGSINAVNAQYFSFGKNRVQYDKFEWRFIQSTHFDIYYYGEKNYELAEFAAVSVESAYKQLQEDFKHDIVNRISVIIYDSHNDFSQTNVINLPIDAEGIGGVTDKLKNRMTIPFTGDYNDFRRTLHHELIHAVINDMFYGGSIQSIIQNNIQLTFPLWFEEGLAEYEALGWDTNTDMYIRDAVINGYLPPVPYLSGYYAYRGGQSIWNYIVEEYGREKIAEILQRIKTSRSVEFGLKQSLGLTIEELNDKWEDALKKRYFPEVAERESADVIAKLMTKRGSFGSYNTSPAISPQGDKIAFITNKRGYFDVVVISALTGEKLKTVIRGEDNPEFEELNILNPNLTWSPDGRKISLSTKTKGGDDIAIVDYYTGKIEKIEFPDLDAIGSVSWSPDGKKLAFDGNIGPYQDIFVYDMPSKKLSNLTKDFFTDLEPSWSGDSKTIFFVSDRGDKTRLGTYTTEFNLLSDNSIYQTDIYSVTLNSVSTTRLTNTPEWSEKQPQNAPSGRIVFLSDKNGIQNLYEFELSIRVATPITDLQAGISQISISADGTRLAFNSINEGYLDIFLLNSPLTRVKHDELVPNYWAKRRMSESQYKRVPATLYAKQMFETLPAKAEPTDLKTEENVQAIDSVETEETLDIDFRNYVFADDVMQDSSLELKNQFVFNVDNNTTDDGRYIPHEYRLKFAADIAYSPSIYASTYGTYAVAQFMFTDLLGDNQLIFGSNFELDLRNSDYSVQYGYLKNRLNHYFSYFHTAQQYQTYAGDLLRFRTFGGGYAMQYPLDKFRRIDFGISLINVRRDYNNIYDYSLGYYGSSDLNNKKSSFLYPELTFTNDKTLAGYITPRGGTRYSVSLSGSPGLGLDSPTFASVLGDFRHYFNMGYRYSFAIRGSGAVSVGRDSQTYFIGGQLGWINQRWSDNGIPLDRLTDTFFTLPALPLRGQEYNAAYGNKFGLINAEFRFPLFAAMIPGAVPIIPFYNVTGVAFVDAGAAWGFNISQTVIDMNGNTYEYARNSQKLDFNVGKEVITYYDNSTGTFTETPNENTQEAFRSIEGDILIGAGFGVRSIVFGLPFRYDVGWPYYSDGFKGKPIHYFSIGIDF